MQSNPPCVILLQPGSTFNASAMSGQPKIFICADQNLNRDTKQITGVSSQITMPYNSVYAMSMSVQPQQINITCQPKPQ